MFVPKIGEKLKGNKDTWQLMEMKLQNQEGEMQVHVDLLTIGMT